MSEAQQVAMIQTLLYFMGHQSYAPMAAQVQSQLQAFSQPPAAGSSTPGGTVHTGWDIAKNQKI